MPRRGGVSERADHHPGTTCGWCRLRARIATLGDMTLQNIAEIVLALAVVGLLIFRQLRWRTFDTARAARLPIVLAAIGVFSLARTSGPALTGTDAGLLAAELAISVGIGALMGRLAAFRPDPAGTGRLQTRTGWAGASLWFVLIAVRIAFDAFATTLGSHVLTETGVILLMVAASRGTAALITRAREPQPLAAA